jgi:EAL domain-containing protein (putative c-di-GMP-specific phosphodiesterase class I)
MRRGPPQIQEKLPTRVLLLLGFSVLVAIFVASLAIGLGRLLHDSIREAAVSGAEQIGQLVAELEIGEEEYAGRDLAPETPADLDDVVEDSDSLLLARLWDPEFHLLYASDRNLGRAQPNIVKLQKAFDGEIASRVAHDGEEEPVLEIYVPIELEEDLRPRSVLEVHLPYEAVQEAIDYRTRNLTAVIVVGALLFYLALLPSVLRGSRALADLYDARQIPLQRCLRRAMRDEELTLVYQPVLDLQSRKIIAVEALLQWRLEDGSIVPAGDYIPLVENTPLIQALTMHVFERAAAQSARWEQQAINVRIAVNVSICNLREHDFAERLTRVAAAHARSPAHFTLEVTESAVSRQAELELRTLKALRRCGFTISIDDFGTGESSLSRVDSVEFQEVKIDRTFMRKLEVDPTVVSGIINLAHALGARTVAEGVESRAVARRLAILGCDAMQGFYLARPMPADEFPAWLLSIYPKSDLVQGATIDAAR